ncbi:MAG TPA: zinc ABC transporter substrate-binding protein [Epsilonproteobacteria bacterium]|nr:zinc ABC transporter substrate-binding protein [Campylobacterota bacterium]
MIKKLLFIAGLCVNNFAYANINITVSILPEQTFVKAIAGDKANISVMVKPGNSPHTYEPKPSQMSNIAKTDIYFAIGVEFEEVWLHKFANLNRDMTIVDLSKKITKIPMLEHHHHDEEGAQEHHEEHEHNALDPHIWISPANVKIMAKDIYENLVKIDSKNQAYYKNNYFAFIEYINQTDTKIREILADTKSGTKFMVFHPAWGYFARDYGLTQMAIESGGKNPKPKQVMVLIREAKEEKVKAIFAEPEFSTKIANIIAKEVGVPVLKISPLNPKWSQNLINLAKSISND